MNLGIPVLNVLWKNHNSMLLNIAKEIVSDNMTETRNKVHCRYLQDSALNVGWKPEDGKGKKLLRQQLVNTHGKQ